MVSGVTDDDYANPGTPHPDNRRFPSQSLTATASARHDWIKLQARSADAAARIEAQRAELDASREYTARMQREAQAEPEAAWQAQAPDEIEMELQ